MGFRHVVLLTLDEDCDVQELIDELNELPTHIAALRRYEVGRDAGVGGDNATVAVVADFDDQSGWETYRDHPAHRAVLDNRIRPHLIDRAAVQHHT